MSAEEKRKQLKDRMYELVRLDNERSLNWKEEEELGKIQFELWRLNNAE